MLAIKHIIDRDASCFWYERYLKKIMYDQLYEHIENFLNQLLCRIRNIHSIQHALFRLLQKWQKELD